MTGTPSGGGAPPAPAFARLAGAAARRLWAWSAPIACALFVLAGAAVVDDYGVTTDEGTQRDLAIATAAYVFDGDDALLGDWNRVFGPAFELPLLFAERALGLEDARDIHLARHLLTHAFFALGGFFCSLLAYRLTGSRFAALAALLLFLLHPRLYAHSFFNSKDIPFLAMFAICLFLAHRAFRGGGAGAFALCGIGVGVLVNMRVAGVLLFAAVLGMRGLDLLQAADGRERRRVLAAGGAFALAAALALYATWPWLWTDPLGRFAEAWASMASRPSYGPQLFRGEWFAPEDFPSSYAPVWFSITTPPLALLLGLAGAAAAALAAASRPREALRNGDRRFGLLLLACFALPPLAAALAGSTLYDGWRHLYFLYAPWCLLAAIGLTRLAAFAAARHGEGGRWAVRVLAVLGLAAALAPIVRLHPQQQAWFNLLADRETPEYLRTQYVIDYWGHPYRELLEHLLERWPDREIRVLDRHQHRINRAILPEAERRRVVLVRDDPDFRLTAFPEANFDDWIGAGTSSPRLVWARKAYGYTVAAVVAPEDRPPDPEAWLARFGALAASAPALRSRFHVHLEGRTLHYLRDDCAASDADARFFLHVTPLDADDLPEERRASGFANLDFAFADRGLRYGGRCMASAPLPDYGVARVATGQFEDGARLWEGEFAVGDR